MSTAAEILAVNSLSALVLALAALAAGRFLHRPAVTHLLWLLVLLKLVTPPLVEVATLPLPVTGVPVLSQSLAPTAALAELSAPVIVQESAVERIAPGMALLGVWLAGSVLLLGLAAWRTRRFGRLVDTAPEVAPAFRSRAESLARRLSTRCPRMRLVDARVPPMLWSRLGRAEILLPGGLLDVLTTHEGDALIAHELAHLRRRDHWVRWIELIVMAAFWWHPVVWWARRRLRLAEEQSCDALVLTSLPERSREYARSLVKTLEFLAGRGPRLPGLATGAGETRHLKERLTMIVEARPPARLSRFQRWGLAGIAVGALLIFPTWADPVPPKERQRILELEDRAIELEHELRNLRAEQREIEHAHEVRQFGLQQQELRQEIDRLASEGRTGELERLEREVEARARQHEAQRAQVQFETERMRGANDFARELGHLRLELDRAASEGDEARVAELQQRMADVQNDFERSYVDTEQSRLRESDELRALQEKEKQAQLEYLREQGWADEARARELAVQEDELRRALEAERREWEHEQQERKEELRRALEAELHEREEELEEQERGDEER